MYGMASTSLGPPQTRDYFAELYVAGVFGNAGRAVYFPKRDEGFDFIVTKAVGMNVLIRPVKVNVVRLIAALLRYPKTLAEASCRRP
jgi:hypothetical protein